ncbi:MAG: hypothetical protein ACOYMG_26110, partial [Candidatus Methylumidiphilus sp.]
CLASVRKPCYIDARQALHANNRTDNKKPVSLDRLGLTGFLISKILQPKPKITSYRQGCWYLGHGR